MGKEWSGNYLLMLRHLKNYLRNFWDINLLSLGILQSPEFLKLCKRTVVTAISSKKERKEANPEDFFGTQRDY